MLTSTKEELSLLHKLIHILQEHCGERADNEGAVETLKRIIRERDNFERMVNDRLPGDDLAGDGPDVVFSFQPND